MNAKNTFEGKYPLELNFVGDGRIFINFWDWRHGNDVIVELKYGKLFLSRYDENAEELPEKEITFAEYVELIKKSVS